MPELRTPRPASESASEMVEVVLPNDANPMGFMLGGNVMRLIDLAGAMAAIRHARTPMVTAAVDELEFLNPVRVGDFVVLKSRVTATFQTSLEVEVLVYSEGALTGERQITSRAHVTFVALPRDGVRPAVPPLLIETDEERRIETAAKARHAEHLKRRSAPSSQ
jgi:acyl-CoA hydrolase